MADMKAMLFIFTFDSSYSMIKYKKNKVSDKVKQSIIMTNF